jgi:protein involved in polysaccharide export with SLBB domain
MLGGCVGGPPPLPQPQPSSTNTVRLEMIPLQSGDQLTVDLQGTPTPMPQLPPMTLSGTGNINLPLLDSSIPAIGKSPHELEQIIHDLYVPKIFTTISVTVTPGPRYFYVTGEVIHSESGKQLYTGKVTVLGAISSCGGFNDYAARTRVQLTRQDGAILIENCEKALKDPTKLDMEVLPGDKIFVDKKTAGEALFPWLNKK